MKNLIMKAIELIGEVDDQHGLRADVPSNVPPGRVRLIVLLPEVDEGGDVWTHGTGKEWSVELSDIREDIYTLEDGESLNAAG
jgi:hypothetical protein